MNKKFKLETIVPPEFYIERKADEQLKNIIDDMGRPASILVSRQMGKTNLLLHTKNIYEDSNNLFIYIDLSIADDDIRNCFQLIVNTAINTNLDTFEKAEVEIEKIRAKNYAPQREHEQELLILSRAFKGKIIICLDEIDSMINFDFSDQFFSQIRSLYFSGRTNYKEFKKLTYILSGVLEPAEIIQDSRKSPFNISEKVYLNDFSKDEYMEFIRRVDLKFLTDEYIEYIYEWTSGHPRMIWDILLKLKSIYESTNNISENDIDETIQFLYLEHSDIPPIDHIQKLVKKNTTIAKILLELKDGIEINISKEMKNELYLYGLINYNDSNKIEIKNKVIEQVLNKDFLNEILYSSQTPLLIGAGYSSQGKFSKAITEYHRALEDKNITEEEKNIAYYSMGICFYHLRNYETSLEYLDLSNMSDIDNLKLFLEQENIKGLCYLHLNSLEKSISTLEKLLKYESIEYKIITYINLISVFLKNYKSSNNKKIEEYLNLSLALIKTHKYTNYEQLSHLHMNKASWAEQNKNHELAIEEYKTILSFDKAKSYKVNVLLKLLKIDIENKDEYLNKIHTLVMSSTELEEYNDPMIFSDLSIAQIVNEYIKAQKDDMLREFLNHSVKHYDKFDSKCSIILLSVNLLYEHINNDVLSILIYTINNYEEKEINSNICYFTLYNILLKIVDKDNNIELIEKYINNFISFLETKIQIDQNHIILLDNVIKTLTNKRKNILASEIYNKVEKLSLKIPKELNILKVSLYDKEFELKEKLDDKIRISYKVLKTLKENDKNIELISGNPRDFFQEIKMKHDLYLFNNKNKLRIGRKDKCPCESGKYFKDCCRGK